MFLHVSGQTPPWTDTHPRAGTLPWADTQPPRDSHCSGPYASYWNAFLFTDDIANNIITFPFHFLVLNLARLDELD